MSLICAKLVRGGRMLRAEPWLEPGGPITIATPKQWLPHVGKLVLVQAGRGVGRVVELLGREDDVRAIMRGLLAEAGLLDDIAGRRGTGGFDAGPVEVLAGVDDRRRDLRSQLVVTIDPPTAKDHDDAIALETADAGADHDYVLWVHIADVAAYVAPGSPVDERAERRGMSAYVPSSVAPMLPHELSSDACSLRPGVDRRCLSVRAELTRDGDVRRTSFERTWIRSARRLAYDEVDDVLAGRRAIDPIIDDLLASLSTFTVTLRERRMSRGALALNLPDTAFTIDAETGAVDDVRLEEESPSHRLVEECMLVANDAVGDRLARAGAPGIWRIHDHPDPESIDALLATFDHLGVPTPPMPEHLSGKLAARIAVDAANRAQRYAASARRGERSFAPRVLRSVKQASYEARPGPHSGLATENYAHFTSPIRRYPDLVNHRALLALLGYDVQPARPQHEVMLIAEDVSSTERDLQRLERRARKITTALHLRRELHAGRLHGDDQSGSFDGEVTGLIGAGLFVTFGDVYEGFVHVRELGGRGGDGSRGERYELDESGLIMIGQTSGHRVRLGDHLKVYVDRVDVARGTIDLRPTPRGDTLRRA